MLNASFCKTYSISNNKILQIVRVNMLKLIIVHLRHCTVVINNLQQTVGTAIKLM